MPLSISSNNTRLFMVASEATHQGRVLKSGLAEVGRLAPGPPGPDAFLGIGVQTQAKIIRASGPQGLVIDRKV